MDRYVVALGPAAIRMLLSARDEAALADALRTELIDGPNADKELSFDSDGNAELHADSSLPAGMIYTATPLSYHAHTALHRRLTGDELARLRGEQDAEQEDDAEQGGAAPAGVGVYVLDILPAELGFTRRPRLYPSA